MTSAPLTVDLLTNTATRGGVSVRLTLQQAELACVLAEASPRPVGNERIISALWGWDEPDDAMRNVRVYISMLRRNLSPLDVGIRCVIKRGYVLEYLEPQPRVASALIDAALAGAGA